MDTLESLKKEIACQKIIIRDLEVKANSTSKKILKEDEHIFRTIFETSKLSNKVIGSDLVILQVNAAMVKLLGLTSKEEIIGKKILDFSPKEYHKHWKRLQMELWRTPKAYFKLETGLTKTDGSEIWCHVVSILFKEGDQTFGYTVIEDITKQHILRQQKDEFISVASHELKTPITSLKAGLQLINRMINTDNAITSKLQKLAKDAELNSSRLTNIVADLLNLSKLEQGDLFLKKTSFNISDLIDTCYSHIELVGDHHITFKGSRLQKIYGDNQKIEQVIVNLVNNAVKYAPDSKEIIISLRKLKKIIKISVSDKGPGISATKLPHLFKRYYQAKKQDGHQSGLGLGLYISSEIIKHHDGEMGVVSKLGKGSKFWFTLPYE